MASEMAQMAFIYEAMESLDTAIRGFHGLHIGEEDQHFRLMHASATVLRVWFYSQNTQKSGVIPLDLAMETAEAVLGKKFVK